MKKGIFYFLLLFTLAVSAQDTRERAILNRMLAACQNLRSSTQVFKSTERMDDGKFYDSEMLIKFQAQPRKVYLYCINPNAGAECLWVKGENDDKVIVNPNGFPYFTLKLNPYNELLR